MGTGKTYSTRYLLDSNNNSGVAGQVLVTTATGVSWQNAESTGDNQTQGSLFDSKIILIDTPNGGLKPYRVITDEYGEWIQVGRFAANAMTSIQASSWSSVSGLSTGTSQSETTQFSADFGDCFPDEVRIMGATDFNNWRNTRTIDFVYKVPAGRKWKHFFSNGSTTGMGIVDGVKYGWTVNGAYDGFGRWTNPSLTSIRMSDFGTAPANPPAAFTTATTNAFYWNPMGDAKFSVSATRTFCGQDTFVTSGVGVDDSQAGFFDEYPNETNNMGGGADFSSAVWVLIKIPGGASGGGGDDSYWSANGNDIHNDNTGNVGIGEDTPTAKLHLGVDSANDDTFHIFNGSVRTHLLASESTNGVIYMRSSANTNTVRINASGDSYFNGGNVGIGSTNPSFQLSIENHATTTSTATMELDGKRTDGTDGPVGEMIFSNNGDTFATVAGFRDGADNKGSLQFQTQDGTFTTKMTISSEGKVGIGTTDPGQNLEVIGNVGLGLSESTTRTALIANTFGYSTAWKTLTLGSAGTNYQTDAVSLCFNVVLNQNSSGSYTGNGSEYFWRKAGKFMTPNSGNNGYNVIFNWSSSGKVLNLAPYNGITFADGQEAVDAAGQIIPPPGRSSSPDPEDYQRSFSTEFKGKTAAGSPSTGSSWIGLMSMSPYRPSISGFYTTQLGFGADGTNGDMFIRRGTTTTWGSWNKILTEGNSGTGPFLPLTGGTMTGNVIFPGEEANSFKIAFTGASASSGISTVDQSGAGLYIGANSRVNQSGNVVYHDSALPSSGIYFDGWNGDDMEFYTGSSGNPTKRLTIDSDGLLKFSKTATTGTAVASINHASNNFLYINGGTEGVAIGDDNQNTRMVCYNDAYIRFDSAGVERMRLTPDGNSTFLILKAKPSTFNSKSFITLYGTNSNTYGGSVIARSSISSETDGTAYGSILKFTTNDTSNVEQNRLTILSNGSVGIGTTNPASEANLSLAANSTSEGGHLALFKGTSQTQATHLDNYANTFRIMNGADASSGAVQFSLNHTTAAATFAGNITTPTQELSTAATPTSFGTYTSEIRLIDTPNGGLKKCRVITDNYGEWILVGRFAADARANIQGTWSSESGLDTSTAQNNITRFSADFGDSYPSEVRIMGATDFTKWRDTRTIDWVYGVPEGRKWKNFFSGGTNSGMALNVKYGWEINGAYDGFGRWVNPAQTFVRMSDTNVTNPSSAYTTATTNAFSWNTASDAKMTVSSFRAYSGQDTTETAGFGADDNIQGFFDVYPSETNNMQGGTGFNSAVWVLIKLPTALSSGSGGGTGNQWAGGPDDIHNTNTGNVGIGNTSPDKLLHVGNGSATLNAPQGAEIEGYNNTLDVKTNEGNNIADFTAALNLFCDGVTGSSGTGTGIYFRAKTGGGGGGEYTKGRIQGAVYTSWTTNTDATRTSKLVIQTTNNGTHADRVTILGNGDFGINDTSPSNKLDVNGDIRGTQYKLRGNVSNPTNTAATIYDQSGVGLTLSAHNVELRNYNGSSMVRSVFFTHNSATFTGTCTATNFILSSDKTLKENIKDIDKKHIDVNWKNFELKSEPGVKRAGVIAQELEAKHPEFVRTNEDGLKSVAYVDLLIAKIAELEARLEKAGI